MISLELIMFVLWFTQDSVTCRDNSIHKTVELGNPVTLTCSYNCSAGFVRGCWRKDSDKGGCHGNNTQSQMCTVSYTLSNVSMEDIKHQYICFTLNTEHPQLPQNIQMIVSLQFYVQTVTPGWKSSTPLTSARTTTPELHFSVSLTTEPHSSEGEFIGIKVLAAVTVAVAIVLAGLAGYLCMSRNRQNWNGKEEPVVSTSGSSSIASHCLLPAKGAPTTQCEKVTLRLPTTDNESDTDVPYADIMIAVRGASTPELTQICYLSPADQRERWRDEACLSPAPRSHMQASRSADRLNVHPRDITRKMSTNSEYAVITYS